MPTLDRVTGPVPHLADKPRGWITEQALFRIDRFEAGNFDERAHAYVLRRLAKAHVPADDSPGTEIHSGPCAECGDPWPCKGIDMVVSAMP